MGSALSAALAVARAAQRAMRYASSRRRSRAAVLVPSRCQPAVPIASGPVTETTTTRRHNGGSRAPGSVRLGRREESSAGARRRRSAPAWPLQVACGRPTPVGRAPVPKWTGTPPCLRRREESSAPDAVAVAGGTPTRATGLSLRSLADTASRALRALGHGSPTPRPRVAQVWSRRARQERRGRVPLER